MEPSRSSSLLLRATLPIRRLLPWPGPAKPDTYTDTRYARPDVAFSRSSLQPFPTPSQGRVRPLLEPWPATGGPVQAPFEIAQAGVQHHDIVLGLIENASRWLGRKNSDQWQSPWPSRVERDERVMAGLANGKTWIVWDGDVAAATVTITTRRNNAVWSSAGCTCNLAERAVFVHRLITSRDYAGQGLGAELIDWAGLRGGREYGARWIRIDVWTTNTGLHDYYVHKGFRRCGSCTDPDYPSGALFQKPVAGILVPRLPKFTETPTESQATEPFVNMEDAANFDFATC